MSKNPKIPDTWGIPDDQANKVREALNKKSIRPEDKVQEAVEELARDLAIIEPGPEDWLWWVTYMLDQLEAEADNKNKSGNFDSMLLELRNYLVARNKRGK